MANQLVTRCYVLDAVLIVFSEKNGLKARQKLCVVHAELLAAF